MSGAQLTTQETDLSALNAAAAWNASWVNLYWTSLGWTPPLMSVLRREKGGGEFCARETGVRRVACAPRRRGGGGRKRWEGDFCPGPTVLPRMSATDFPAARQTMPSPPLD